MNVVEDQGDVTLTRNVVRRSRRRRRSRFVDRRAACEQQLQQLRARMAKLDAIRASLAEAVLLLQVCAIGFKLLLQCCFSVLQTCSGIGLGLLQLFICGIHSVTHKGAQMRLTRQQNSTKKEKTKHEPDVLMRVACERA